MQPYCALFVIGSLSVSLPYLETSALLLQSPLLPLQVTQPVVEVREKGSVFGDAQPVVLLDLLQPQDAQLVPRPRYLVQLGVEAVQGGLQLSAVLVFHLRCEVELGMRSFKSRFLSSLGYLNLSQKAHVCIQHVDALLCPNTVVPFELGPRAQKFVFKHCQLH